MAATVKWAEYPQRKCRDPLWSDQNIAYNCELPDLHEGPCASPSIGRTINARAAWEEANPDLVGAKRGGGDIILDGPGDRQ